MTTFYLDEHMDPVLGKILTKEGYNVVEAKNRNPGGSDREQLEIAAKLNAVIVTRDDDFLKIVDNEDFSQGIIIVNKYYRPRTLADKINELMTSVSKEDLHENVFYV